jgi:hypothetical protein
MKNEYSLHTNNWMIKMRIEIDNSQLINDIVEKVVELG